MQRYGIVLAAGQGKRMKSKLYKVLHPVCGKPMVGHVIAAMEDRVDRLVTVVGHGAEAVRGYLGDRTEYVLQAEQLGTGHAVMQAADLLSGKPGTTLVVCGDTPLISGDTVARLIEFHERRQAAVTILTAVVEQPGGYGRIIREPDGSVSRIVEQKDCTPDEERVREINTGTYCFDNRKLFEALKQVTNDNAQGEYYLTDVISILKQAGDVIGGFALDDPDEAIGVNDRVALARAERLMRDKIVRAHMLNGVTIIDPKQTWIGPDVRIGQDTVLYPGTHLEGNTEIGSGCRIGPNVQMTDSVLGDEVTVRQSVLESATAEAGVNIGPFAYLRPGSYLEAGVKIGDFVEIKNSRIGTGSKVPHHSYIGDAHIGSGVNIGCGVITANYDGFRKHRTVIEDDAFIGSNVNLIAPVTVGKGAFVVAGSTITDNVDEDGVAIARPKQTTKKGYASKLKKRIQLKGQSSDNNTGGQG